MGKYIAFALRPVKEYLLGAVGNKEDSDSSVEDVLEPQEIGFLSTAKVIEVSAGESHSAAITKAHKLYTWGNGSYGRLGHGF